MWRRFIRSKAFILLTFMVIFSFGMLGKIDTRMHIGGGDWDLDNLIYINVSDYILDDQIKQTVPQEIIDTVASDFEPEDNVQTESVFHDSFDFVTGAGVRSDVMAKANEGASADYSNREELVPPTPSTPKVEEKRKPTIFIHKVHAGETLWDIATAYGITIDTILSANDFKDPNRISIGQELQILSVQGVLHKVVSGESLWEIAERYEITVDDISKANDIADPSQLAPNTKIVIPGATRLRPRYVLVVNGQLQKAFDWPVKGRISSPFGPRWGSMHNGMDIAVPTGTPIKAAADGRVTFAGWNGGYGILVIVDHGNGVETRYAHNSRLNVKMGQKVERGQVVSYSGNTGNSTGPHLHFEIRQRNTPVNPHPYLR